MTEEDLQRFLRDLGYTVEVTQDRNGAAYTLVRNVTVPDKGSLARQVCDIALQRTNSVPYMVSSAIHTRPALVRMDMDGPLKTQASPLGDDWQYWSRRFDHTPTPRAIWTHVLTILTEV